MEHGGDGGRNRGSRGDANAKMDNDVHQGRIPPQGGREGIRHRGRGGWSFNNSDLRDLTARPPRDASEKGREREREREGGGGREGLTDSRDFVLLKPAFSLHANFKSRRRLNWRLGSAFGPQSVRRFSMVWDDIPPRRESNRVRRTSSWSCDYRNCCEVVNSRNIRSRGRERDACQEMSVCTAARVAYARTCTPLRMAGREKTWEM